MRTCEGMVIVAALALLCFGPFAHVEAATASPATSKRSDASLPEVPPVDWSKIRLDDFTDTELDLPYPLHHLHTVANAVVESGPNRGWIDLRVWRNAEHNKPFNARV